jgi:hypothetical protein
LTLLSAVAAEGGSFCCCADNPSVTHLTDYIEKLKIVEEWPAFQRDCVALGLE